MYIESNSVQYRVFAFLPCDNAISVDWHVCIDR